ncbi:MAG: serine/threonine protein kinase [Myxococcaceae bacterium]|nr:serine/threonine protein kinase [Myxococcaceae bacterium]
MGVVFEAVNTATEKQVALKFLSPSLALATEAAERFKLEARATGRIHHPNVVAIHDCGMRDGSLFLVMELLKGRVLREWLSNRQLDLAAACQILIPVMRGVAAAHAAGVLHRDLKPDNIFLADSPDGLEPVPKVLDFGLAKLSAAGDKVTQLSAIGAVMGTYQFMAPEQLRSQGELDARVDVYALGAVLFQMLAGRPPYRADNPVDLALQILESEAPAITSFAIVPEGAAPVLARALARDRSARYGSIEEFAVALEPFSGGTYFRGSKRPGFSRPAAQVPSFSVTEQFNVPPLSTPYRPSAVVAAKPRSKSWALVTMLVLGLSGLAWGVRYALQNGAAPLVVASPAAAPAPVGLQSPAAPTTLAPGAPAQRPQAATPQAQGEGLTFEEPTAPGAEWGEPEQTWPSPLPEGRSESTRAARRVEPSELPQDSALQESPRERRHRRDRHEVTSVPGPVTGSAREPQQDEQTAPPATATPDEAPARTAHRVHGRGGSLAPEEF